MGKKTIIREWFYRDGKFVEKYLWGTKPHDDIVDVALGKFIDRVGFDEACVMLVDLFGHSRSDNVVMQILLEFNNNPVRATGDFLHIAHRPYVLRMLHKLQSLELVKMIEKGRGRKPTIWRINDGSYMG